MRTPLDIHFLSDSETDYSYDKREIHISNKSGMVLKSLNTNNSTTGLQKTQFVTPDILSMTESIY